MMSGPDRRERVGVTNAETDIDITTGEIHEIIHVVKEVATIKILREALSNHLFIIIATLAVGEEETIDIKIMNE